MQIGAVESSMEINQKIKNGTALWLCDSTSGNLSKETRNTNSKEYKHPYVHCSIIYSRQDMEAGQLLVDEWLKQLWDIYTMEYFLVIKKKKIFTLCNSMNVPGKQYAKWNKPVRERQTPYDITHM